MNESRRRSSPELPAIARKAEVIAARSPQILIVDDSPAIVSFVRAYLVRSGCELVEANDAQRAMRLASLMLVDLIIADVNMPGMSGIEMVRSLRHSDNPRLRDVPIVLMTGDKNRDLETQAREAGTNEFVLKPISSSDLNSTVERLLRPAA